MKNEQEQILKKEKLDLEFFKPKYKCKKCNDTGFIKYENQKTEMCTCLKQKLINISYNKSNLSNLQRENFKNFDENKFSNEEVQLQIKRDNTEKSTLTLISKDCSSETKENNQTIQLHI